MYQILNTFYAFVSTPSPWVVR